jgi:Ni/Co efflux regulator RcnB
MKKLALIALAASAAIIPAAAHAQMTHGGPGGPNVVVRHQGGPSMHPGPNFRHRRLQRGFFVHPFWFGPQFHVRNWQTYGFAPPPPEHRWIRYYDDAHLIDRRGRVMDSRHGLDWDQYGERWEMDDGIPS